MKIYRFNNNPSQLPDCWQKSITGTATLPCFDADLEYVIRELRQANQLKYYKFGFTKSQLIKACRTFKNQAKFCIDKSILRWSKASRLVIIEIDSRHVWEFEDQVMFDQRKVTTKLNKKEQTV